MRECLRAERYRGLNLPGGGVRRLPQALLDAMSERIRLAFHALKPFRDRQTQAVKRLVDQITPDFASVEFAFLHVNDAHNSWRRVRQPRADQPLLDLIVLLANGAFDDHARVVAVLPRDAVEDDPDHAGFAPPVRTIANPGLDRSLLDERLEQRLGRIGVRIANAPKPPRTLTRNGRPPCTSPLVPGDPRSGHKATVVGTAPRESVTWLR